MSWSRTPIGVPPAIPFSLSVDARTFRLVYLIGVVSWLIGSLLWSWSV
jgi:hypothetical protein